MCGAVLPSHESLLTDLTASLNAGGLISVVSVNRYPNAYQAAFLENDLPKAFTRLDARRAEAKLFNTTVTCNSADEVSEVL